MGNILSSFRRPRHHHPGGDNNYGSRRTEAPSSSTTITKDDVKPSSSTNKNKNNKNNKKINKYDYVPDRFSSLDQVTDALRQSGLESSNLILGIDFSKSNEWTGKISSSNRSLHAIIGDDTPNPYEKAISVIGKTLPPFDEDNLIPCFGFRDGPTSYGRVIDAAVDIVERNGGQYHVLVIIAGPGLLSGSVSVTRSVDTGNDELSPQEDGTINSIVNASLNPLSIVLVGVGDGPWEDMKKFDDRIPTLTIFRYATDESGKETAFALAALMEIPIQYKEPRELGLLGYDPSSNRQAWNVDSTSPFNTCDRESNENKASASSLPYIHRGTLPRRSEPSELTTPTQNDQDQVCPVCLTIRRTAFGCGHTVRFCFYNFTSSPSMYSISEVKFPISDCIIENVDRECPTVLFVAKLSLAVSDCIIENLD